MSASSCPKNSVSARLDEFLNVHPGCFFKISVFSDPKHLFMCVKRDKTHREIYNLKKNTDVIVDRACVAINACSWSHVGVD